MRHQSRLIAERVKQVAIGFDGIDRGETQPLQLRHLGQNAFHQGAETGPVRRMIARDIDAGEHDFSKSTLDQRAHLINHIACRQRARIAPPKRNDAERAAMVTPVLDLHEAARSLLMRRGDRNAGAAHDVADRDLLSARSLPSIASEFLVIADDARDLRHIRKHRWVCLRRAAGHDDASIRVRAGLGADCLTRLPHGLGGDRAGVDDDNVVSGCALRSDAHLVRIRRR